MLAKLLNVLRRVGGRNAGLGDRHGRVFRSSKGLGAPSRARPVAARATIGRRAACGRFSPNRGPTQRRFPRGAACRRPPAKLTLGPMTRVGFFSGSFDPMTNGHLDVIEHAAALCDRLVVGVGSNPNKAALFTVKERLKLIREAAAPIMAKAAMRTRRRRIHRPRRRGGAQGAGDADRAGPARRNRFRL